MPTNTPKAIKVYFEVTNACNFDCDFCPSSLSGREKRHMDFALLQKGIDEVAGERIADTVGFHILGEPLLYPRIYDAIAYARSKGLYTEINTNGSLLTEERVRRLIDAGLDDLAISVQVLGQREHSCRGTTMPFDEYYRRVLDAVRLIRRSRSALDVTVCFMNTSTIKYFDIDRFMRLNASRRAVEAKLAPFLVDLYAAIDRPAAPQAVQAAVRKLNLLRPQMLRLDRHTCVYAQPFADWGNAFTSRKVHAAQFGSCGYGMRNIGVLNSGAVTICCADYDGRTALGNLQTDSLAGLLSSERAHAIRAGFDRLQLVHPYCRHCLGSPNPAKAVFKALGSVYLFRWLQFQPARVRETQIVPEEPREAPALQPLPSFANRLGAALRLRPAVSSAASLAPISPERAVALADLAAGS